MRLRMLPGRTVRLSAAAAVLTAALALPALVAAQGAATQWRAALVGGNEVPPGTSTATGTFTATLDEAAGTLTWTLTVPSITSATAAHLHQAAAGANGSVVLPLYTPPAGTTVSTLNLTGTARAADIVGPLAGNFAGFVTALKGGTIYANVHTTANPGGEIRAQVIAATAAAPAQATAAAPAAPKTGSAGIAGEGSTAGMLMLLAALAVGVVAGARALASRRSAR